MKLIKNRVLLKCFILAVYGLGVARGQNPPSPCPDVFDYQRDENNWYGVFTGRDSSYGDKIKTTIYMKYDGKPKDADVGNVIRLTSSEDLPDIIARGGGIRYRVALNVQPLPRLHRIEFNGRVICQSQREESEFGVTTARREHTLYPKGKQGSSADVSTTKRFYYTTERTRLTTRYQSTQPAAPSPSPSADCGVREPLLNHLIVSGVKTTPGEWPWLVALFHSTITRTSFKCGATLLGNRFVITAAHCVYDQVVKEQMNAENIVIIVGMSDVSLNNFDDDNTRTLSGMQVHEDYDPETNTNDIALLELEEPVVPSAFVKPVCLWDGDDNQDHLVKARQYGTVVGWGETGSGTSTQVPRRIDVPVISLNDCRGSHFIYHSLTTDKSLCAGARDNKGPCNGDSGGGLYIKQNERWRLRGLVSSSLKGTSLGSTTCNLTLPVIYTDVAKYRNWISDAIYWSQSSE